MGCTVKVGVEVCYPWMQCAAVRMKRSLMMLPPQNMSRRLRVVTPTCVKRISVSFSGPEPLSVIAGITIKQFGIFVICLSCLPQTSTMKPYSFSQSGVGIWKENISIHLRSRILFKQIVDMHSSLSRPHTRPMWRVIYVIHNQPPRDSA